mgnify:CR=1 FL=1
MRRKFFTEEEMSILRKNPYTYKITPRHIYFTAEFKKEFLRLYNENNTIKDCVRLLGFDPDILGNARINSLRRSFLKQLGNSNLAPAVQGILLPTYKGLTLPMKYPD